MDASDTKNRNPFLWSAVGVALGLALLYVATRKVKLSELIETITSVELLWALVILAITLTFNAIKAWRWGLLLRFVPNIRFADLHSAVYVGLALNFLVAHVGEILRSTMIARHTGAAISAVFASVVVERALDFIALLLLLALFALLAPQLPDVVKIAGAITALTVFVTIAALFTLLDPPGRLADSVSTLARRLPVRIYHWLREQLDRSRRGLESIRNPRLMIVAIAVSVMQWSLVVIAIWWSASAIGQSLSLTGATVTFILIVLGLTVPSSPMQIGTTQLAFTIGYGMDGISATVAVAASIVYTLFLILPIMVIGGICLIRRRRRPIRQLS